MSNHPRLGIHHVTGITADVQANVDFYMGFLGLHLVKRTGGYEDAEQLHLFYGDASGSPGSLVSFLVWQDGMRGRTGLGAVSELSFAVASESIGDWLTKAMQAGIQASGPTREFGEPVLRLKDPDGMIVKLVGVANAAPQMRIRGVTILTDKSAETAAFIERFGYSLAQHEGAVRRLASDFDVVDVREVAGYVPALQGAGVADHVAFRAKDAEAVREMRLALKGAGPTPVHDRTYFLSLYVREPGECLIEYATDGPGMSIDEAPDALGKILFIPPRDAERSTDLRLQLPQFALPGEERRKMRDTAFIHRFHEPQETDGSLIVLLHGTGGNEADLMPLGHRINPKATLLGLRGRSTEEGINRWFRRFDAVTYDQEDIQNEAAALADFIADLPRLYGFESDKITLLGYSNGANLMGAVMQLHPGVIKKAILLRALQALEATPAAVGQNAGVEALMLSGARDPFGLQTPALEAALSASGVSLEHHMLPVGHELAPADLAQAAAWLAARA